MKLRYSEFKDRIDIDAFENAIGFVPVNQSRDEDTGKCLDVWGLHKNGDTTGKFSINREKRVYNCWVCGGGSLLDLAMAVTDKDPSEGTEWLYEFAIEKEEYGTELEDQIDSIFDSGRPKITPALPYFNEKVLARFDDSYHPWYKERGITRETQEAYCLRISREHKRKNKEGEVYNGPAIILPHFWQHKLVGWQERWLDLDRPKWISKYTNTPDFPKEETLYNYDISKGSGRHGYTSRVVICESVPTVLRLASLGVTAVGTFGASVSLAQIHLLTVFQDGIILAADNDKPGLKWKKNLTEVLEEYVPVWWSNIVPGEGSDLGDLEHDEEVIEYCDNAYLPWESDL